MKILENKSTILLYALALLKIDHNKADTYYAHTYIYISLGYGISYLIVCRKYKQKM